MKGEPLRRSNEVPEELFILKKVCPVFFVSTMILCMIFWLDPLCVLLYDNHFREYTKHNVTLMVEKLITKGQFFFTLVHLTIKEPFENPPGNIDKQTSSLILGYHLNHVPYNNHQCSLYSIFSILKILKWWQNANQHQILFSYCYIMIPLFLYYSYWVFV